MAGLSKLSAWRFPSPVAQQMVRRNLAQTISSLPRQPFKVGEFQHIQSGGVLFELLAVTSSSAFPDARGVFDSPWFAW